MERRIIIAKGLGGMVMGSQALRQFAPRQQVLLYPAAGFDWKVPLALLRLVRRRPWLPVPQVALYVDYSAELLRQLEQVHVAGDSMVWGPQVRVENIEKIAPPSRWVWQLRQHGRHAPEGGSVTGDDWYSFTLRLGQGSLPVIYIPADAVAFVRHVLAPGGLRPVYVATVTDGCRQGGNWCCLSKKEGPFFRAMAEANTLPRYWLTDHGNLEPGFTRVAQVSTGVYGGGYSSLLTLT